MTQFIANKQKINNLGITGRPHFVDKSLCANFDFHIHFLIIQIQELKILQIPVFGYNMGRFCET
jgi:hypothetical protein